MKPTLGVMPKYLWYEKRAFDLIEAINRRIEAKQPIPIEWIEEYNELI